MSFKSLISLKHNLATSTIILRSFYTPQKKKTLINYLPKFSLSEVVSTHKNKYLFKGLYSGQMIIVSEVQIASVYISPAVFTNRHVTCKIHGKRVCYLSMK